MKTNLLLIAALLALAGCASSNVSQVAPGVVQAYPGPARERKDVAILKGSYWMGTRTQFSSYADLARGGELQFEKLRGFGGDYPQEMHLLPGRYLIMTRCGTNTHFGFPGIQLDLRAGATYEINCEPGTGASGQVTGKAFISQQYPTDYDKR